ncbi:hypothetical protein J9317_17470 [Metabacillus sp. KIGAM252]|uniref:Uncharacterized protein n=1 Tax=Metabacillus flavus TaxID=2823519 RepID=A0ABS5LJ06_9BACI|nr:hypothetical protein [Metabacillus flavus]MBS2970538.1 hypothetical protein [Metabacillus flavus]
MNIFQIKTRPHGTVRLNEFIQGNFIAIGWPRIGNLAGVSKEEIRIRLQKAYGHTYDNPRTISVDLGNIWAFVDTMQEGAVALFHGHLDNVHIVEVGAYEYVEEFDNNEDGMCHQRKFKPLTVVKFDELNSKLQELLRHRGTVTRFKYPLEDAELEALIYSQSDLKHPSQLIPREVPEDIINKALEVLDEALHSSDPDKRFKAAVEILRYVK